MGSDTQNIEKAASRLWRAYKTREVCEPIRELIGIRNLDSAYAIQKINRKLRITEGGKIIGSKIGLTSVSVQKQLGVDQPDFGMLWRDNEILNGGEISVSELMQPKAEAEIAFVLGKDLDNENLTSADVISCLLYTSPSPRDRQKSRMPSSA